MNKYMQRIKIDYVFTAILIAIIGYGTCMIFSSSSILGIEAANDMYFFLKKHIVNMTLGLLMFYFAASIKYQYLRKFVKPINYMGLVLMGLVFLSPFNKSVNGAGRWVEIAGFSFQPSEIGKIIFIFTLAHILDRIPEDRLNTKKNLIKIASYIAIWGTVVLSQKHMSAMGIYLLIAVSILLMAGLAIRYLITLGTLVLGAGVIAVMIEPFRLQRIKTLFDPMSDPMGAGYQITQSWYGLGSGELFGLGLGMSRQKFSWLPENHTDFIVAIIGEETGLVGIAVLIVLFACLIVGGITIASNAPDRFSSLLVFGIIALIFFQVLINFLVVTGWFPVTGMPVPFISYGGSSTIVLFGAMGLIYNVISQSKQKN